MHSEHDRTHGHGLRVRQRGRMPYTESRDLPSPAPVEPLVEPVEPLVRPIEPPIMPVPPVMPVEPLVRACPFGESPWAETAGETGGVSDPSTRRSWVDIESRPFSMPPPPGRWDRPWSQISRDQLLRPALIVGFLAAAGAGIWLSGWSPSPDPPMVEAVPGPTARRSLTAHDMTVPPTSGATPNAPSHSRAPAPQAPASGAKASAERERERRTTRGRKSAASLPARTSRSLANSDGGAHGGNRGDRGSGAGRCAGPRKPPGSPGPSRAPGPRGRRKPEPRPRRMPGTPRPRTPEPHRPPEPGARLPRTPEARLPQTPEVRRPRMPGTRRPRTPGTRRRRRPEPPRTRRPDRGRRRRPWRRGPGSRHPGCEGEPGGWRRRCQRRLCLPASGPGRLALRLLRAGMEQLQGEKQLAVTSSVLAAAAHGARASVGIAHEPVERGGPDPGPGRHARGLVQS